MSDENGGLMPEEEKMEEQPQVDAEAEIDASQEATDEVAGETALPQEEPIEEPVMEAESDESDGEGEAEPEPEEEPVEEPVMEAEPEAEPEEDDGEEEAEPESEEERVEEPVMEAEPEAEPDEGDGEEETEPEPEEEPAEEPVMEAEPEAEPDEGDGKEETEPEPEEGDEEEAEPEPVAEPVMEAEAEPAESVLDEPDDGRAWYVLHCYSGYENKVRHNLEQRIDSMGMKDRIFDVVVPTEEEIEVKEGKRRTVERRVFPGYILVNMILSEESWYVVRNTPGVTSFVGQGNEPLPLRPEEVSQIIKRMEADAPRIKVSFKKGERVRIVDGPFNDFRGTVDEIDMERTKVRVMVNFFGRETPVELDFLQVEKA